MHEVKHDGFRGIARKNGKRVRLYSRPGNDLTQRFPLLADALSHLRAASCIIDGEAVAVGPDGIPSFDRLRYRRRDSSVGRPSHATSHGQTRDTWAHQRVG
jgi:bifunctional non-homologous end joining protein LigD